MYKVLIGCCGDGEIFFLEGHYLKKKRSSVLWSDATTRVGATWGHGVLLVAMNCRLVNFTLIFKLYLANNEWLKYH